MHKIIKVATIIAYLNYILSREQMSNYSRQILFNFIALLSLTCNQTMVRKSK